jgi:hypothetical protein
MNSPPILVPIVEGDGEVEAVPILLRRFQERLQNWNFQIARPKNAHGKYNLLKPGGFERFLGLCSKDSGCQGVLVLETLAGKTLKGRLGIATGTEFENDYEKRTGVKEWLSSHMGRGRTYKETLDQAPMTQHLDLDKVAERCRAFRRMWSAFNRLQGAVGQNLTAFVTPECK